MNVKSLSRVRLFVTPWTVAYQAPLSMGFSRQEYWSGVPFPSPVDLPDPGIEPGSSALQANALPSEPPRLCIVFKIIYFSFLRALMHRVRSRCPPPKVKWLELHSLWTETPRGEEQDNKGEGWALPRPHISHSPNQESSPTTHGQKCSLQLKWGTMSRDALLTCFFSRIRLD